MKEKESEYLKSALEQALNNFHYQEASPSELNQLYFPDTKTGLVINSSAYIVKNKQEAVSDAIKILTGNSNTETPSQERIASKIRDLFFSPPFIIPRALWGESNIITAKLNKDKTITYFEIKAWEYHLQQMVILQNQVDYLK